MKTIKVIFIEDKNELDLEIELQKIFNEGYALLYARETKRPGNKGMVQGTQFIFEKNV